MGKSGGNQTVTQRPDALTQNMRQTMWNAGLAAAGMPTLSANPADVYGAGGMFGSVGHLGPNPGGGGAPGAASGMGGGMGGPGAAQPVPGIDPLTGEAISNYQGYANAGNLGMRALSGDAEAFGTLMNPYQSNVLDQMMNQFGTLSQKTAMGINDEATRAGAFGGSRHGVAEGVAQGELASDTARQMAALQYQGFNDAMGRAGGLANMGMGANAAMNDLGEYRRQVAQQQDPALRRMQILQMASGMMPAGGMTTSQPMTRNLGQGILGGAATGYGMFGPWGALAGGLFGAL